MGFNYITDRRSSTLSNEPYEITQNDITIMIMENAADEEECKHVTESTYRGESYYIGDGRPGTGKIADPFLAICKEVLYRDAKTSGFVMDYPHGRIVKQAERNHYYRGENRIYEQSSASIFRNVSSLKTNEERSVDMLISNMRIAEFQLLLKRFELIQRWEKEFGTVLYEPLAQHYGLRTHWLDITNDFKVALFFACCRWDDDEKLWYPLTKKETEQNRETQYGVLFHIPKHQVDLRSIMRNGNTILPIGFQPFNRCNMQNGYGIEMETPFPLQEDIYFEKLHFRHDEELSRRIYEDMGEGRKIYPQDGLSEFADVIDKIKTSTIFSEEAFKIALRQSSNFFDNEAMARKALVEVQILNAPVTISKTSVNFGASEQRVQELNCKTKEIDFQKDLGIQLTTRPVYL